VQTSSAVFDVQKARTEFPILKRSVNGHPVAYLDNGATAQKPEVLMDATERFLREENSNVHRGVHTLSQWATDRYEHARRVAQMFLGAAEARECLFTPGTTGAINLVAQSYARPNLKPGDRILLSESEHHSNIVPWQLVAEQTGAKLLVARVTDDGLIDLGSFERRLSEGPRIVAIQHVSNVTGAIQPVRELTTMAHAAGATVLIDGAQSAPHISVDVQAIDSDFYTFSAHKVYGPTGIGILYGKAELLDSMPPYQGGGSMISTVTFERTTYADAPQKFEAGTPHIVGAVGMAAVLEWFMGLDRVGVEAHEALLVRTAFDRLREVPGLRLFGMREPNAGIVSFVMDCAHAHDVGTILDAEGIAIRVGHHCCMPLMHRFGVAATARASFALYNTVEEVERLASGLQKVREIFG
jgi:cysteine desulfurase/selenocysteine lyase